MQSFLLMLTFMTRIPAKIKGEVNDDAFSRGVLFMPLIGLIIGFPLWILKTLMASVDEGITVFLVIIGYLLVTGGLHLDGLADYFDGMFSARAKERVFEIMSDSRIGAFGVIGLILYFLGFYSGGIRVSAMAFLLMPIVGRVMAVNFCAYWPYPKEKGLAKGMVDATKPWIGIVYSGLLCTLCLYLGITYLLSVLVVLLFTLLMGYKTTKVIGGVTGDVIGAGVEISQVVWLVSVALIGGML